MEEYTWHISVDHWFSLDFEPQNFMTSITLYLEIYFCNEWMDKYIKFISQGSVDIKYACDFNDGLVPKINKLYHEPNIDGFVQDCGNSSADALELPQSCTKLSICSL